MYDVRCLFVVLCLEIMNFDFEYREVYTALNYDIYSPEVFVSSEIGKTTAF